MQIIIFFKLRCSVALSPKSKRFSDLTLLIGMGLYVHSLQAVSVIAWVSSMYSSFLHQLIDMYFKSVGGSNLVVDLRQNKSIDQSTLWMYG